MIGGGGTALALAAICLGFFFFLGYRNRQLSDDSTEFWLAGGKISNAAQFFTWFASIIAFSSAIFYYMQITAIWGYWVFIGSIGTYIFGQIVAVGIISKSGIQLDAFETVGRLVEERGGCALTGRAIDYMNALALFALVYIEIGLGVKIFSSLFPSAGIEFELLCFVALAAIPFFYIRLGGFQAIVRSDVWQGILIFIGLACFLMFVGFFMQGTSTDGPFSIPKPNVGFDEVWPYLGFAAVVNLLISVPQVSVWQRFAASSEGSKKYLYAIGGICAAALTFTLYVFVANGYLESGLSVNTVADVFAPISSGPPIVIEVLFPLIFVGFVAALVSSADSASIGAIMALFGRNNIHLTTREWTDKKNKALYVLAIALVGMFIFHIFVETTGSGFFSVFLTVIFYLYSQLAIAAPIVVLAALAPNRLRGDVTSTIGLFIAWFITTVGFLAPSWIAKSIPFASEVFEGNYTGGMTTVLIALAIVLIFSIRISKGSTKDD